MTAPVFFVDTSCLREASRVLVSGDEGRHAVVVRRLKVGEEVVLTDGRGVGGHGVVAGVDNASLTVDVRSLVSQPPPQPRLTVVQALPKAERGERAVAAMSEVGVDVIVPWAAARCVMQWKGARAERGCDRWVATAQEAAKQSRRLWWPRIHPLSSSDDVVQLIEAATVAVVLDAPSGTSLTEVRWPDHGEVLLIVGPEGGLTDQELDDFGSAGARSARLGPTVLRTSTAGVVAATVVLSAGQRWSLAPRAT